VSMAGERWARLQALFHRALELPPAARGPFLDGECADDPGLLRDALALLAEDAAPGGVLDGGAAALAGGVLDSTGDSWPPGAFGPYRLRKVLGEGGMGVVHLAERVDVGGLVAIKILRDASLSPARRERFLSEQRTLAQLDHPSIARLYDAGTLADGTPWFAMEYVEGVPLTTYCRTRRTSVPGRIELFRAVCEAVQYAHRHALIHRDLKPSNIHVKADGTVKLLDFGIAKQLDAVEGDVEQTQTGQRFLTPAYAAPEQIRGEHLGIYTDVYALGVVLYELLTDLQPFDLARCTPSEALAFVAQREPERPSAVVRRTGGPAAGGRQRPVPRGSWADLDVLCLTAMHKDPQRRYRTVDALIGDLDRFLRGQPLAARPDTLGYRAGKFVRRHRAAVAATTGALIVVLGLVGFYTARLADQRSLARAEAAKATQITEYLIGLFEAGDPFAAGGGGTDVHELLARGVRQADALAGQPGVQAQMLDVLGRVHTRLGDYDQAEGLLRRALGLRRAPGATRTDLATTLMNLADLFRYAGRYDSAEAYAREALAIRERALPSTHPDLATTMDGLGIVLSNRGDYAAAADLQRRALAMRRNIYDRPHELLAHSLNNLAVTLANQGDYATAERYLVESVALSVQVLGADHASLASDLSNLGVVREIQGDYAGADSALSAALRIKRLRLGDDHWETAFTLQQLGGVLRRAGQDDRAEASLREAMEIERRVLDPDHRNTAITRTHLAAVLQGRGDYAGAETLYREAAAILAASLGEGHQFTATTRCALGHVLRQQRRLPEAEALFRMCLAVLEEVLPADHDVLAAQRGRFGGLLAAQGKFDDAEPILLESYATLRSRFGPDHADVRDAAGRLVELYEAWGRLDAAEPFRPGGSTRPG
jgi:eukaryotic-like serine/threonine-protein kinase